MSVPLALCILQLALSHYDLFCLFSLRVWTMLFLVWRYPLLSFVSFV